LNKKPSYGLNKLNKLLWFNTLVKSECKKKFLKKNRNITKQMKYEVITKKDIDRLEANEVLE
jgi:hypothetical protein